MTTFNSFTPYMYLTFNLLTGEKLGDSLTLPIPGIYSNKPTKEEVTIKTEPSVTIATHTVMSTPPATVSPAQLPTPRVNNPVFSPNDKRDRDEVWKQYLTRSVTSEGDLYKFNNIL